MRKLKSKPKNEENFINAVDEIQGGTFDPEAARNFKQVSLPMNEYEFQLLTAAAKKEGRSQKNFIRQAIIEKAKEILK